MNENSLLVKLLKLDSYKVIYKDLNVFGITILQNKIEFIDSISDNVIMNYYRIM